MTKIMLAVNLKIKFIFILIFRLKNLKLNFPKQKKKQSLKWVYNIIIFLSKIKGNLIDRPFFKIDGFICQFSKPQFNKAIDELLR